MPTLLRIDSSARHEGSRSRRLGDEIEAGWLACHAGGAVHRRDLATDPISQITERTIAGFYGPQDAMTDELRVATALSDTLIGELRSADTLLITAPMYNFTVPAALKAWIDQIVRIGRTFGYDGAMAGFDLLQSYLKLLFGFLGFSDIHLIGIEGTAGDDAAVAASTERARDAVERALAA